MAEIVDLSQEIFNGMPVFKGLPEVKIEVYATHEEWEGRDTSTKTPSVLKMHFGEHTGTHVDALSHMDSGVSALSIDKMPLSMFYTEGICLDFRHKGLSELIYAFEIRHALRKEGLTIQKGDTVLLCTDHYKNFYGKANWENGPGLTAEATRWLGEQGIAAFGVETMSPGVRKVSNRQVHQVCGKFGFTHYENMVNLDKLLARGRFEFIALPLKIRGGTGSPVRAVAVFK
jgi:kynurenine formamidase